jgi:hypothetical protein
VRPELAVATTDQAVVPDPNSTGAIEEMAARNLGIVTNGKIIWPILLVTSYSVIEIEYLGTVTDRNASQIPEKVQVTDSTIGTDLDVTGRYDRESDLGALTDRPAQRPTQ